MKGKGKSGKTGSSWPSDGGLFQQFRGGRWKQLWGMREVDERRKGISSSVMTSGCQSVVWGRLQVFEKCRK